MNHDRRGQMLPRGDRKWLLRVYVGRDAQSKKRYVAKVFEGTTYQARQELDKMLHQSNTKTIVRPTKQTLSGFVEQWFKWKVDIAPSTLDGYRRHLNLYILPHLGHRKLTDITPLGVQDTITRLIDQGLAPRTIEYAHTILHQVCEKAIELGLLLRNPTNNTTRPEKVQREFTVLSPEQMMTLLNSESKSPYCALWLLMLNTGLRPGEALALRWSDLEGNTLRVNQVLSRKGDGSYYVVEQKAKTKKSLRSVTVSATVVEALKAHRQKTLALGGFIFPGRSGGFLDPQNVAKRFKSALRRAGLPSNVRLYDTRHSHATALLNAGTNLKWVSERLGHSSVTTTEAVYAQVLPEAHKEMADTMEAILLKTQASK